MTTSCAHDHSEIITDRQGRVVFVRRHCAACGLLLDAAPEGRTLRDIAEDDARRASTRARQRETTIAAFVATAERLGTIEKGSAS